MYHRGQGYGPYSDGAGWCDCFVSWSANQCGYVDAGIIPKFSGCEWGVSWFRQYNLWADNRILQTPGITIFFDWEDEEGGRADHVGIVEKVENGRVYTIEGNTAYNFQERSYALGHFEILGYGVHAY